MLYGATKAVAQLLSLGTTTKCPQATTKDPTRAKTSQEAMKISRGNNNAIQPKYIFKNKQDCKDSR